MSEVNVMEPKTRRGLATRNKILKAAERLFGEKGYYNTSINDIAVKAEVAPGTLYIYFKDKYTLYCYLVKHYSHTLRSEIAKRIKAKGNATRREKERIGILYYLQTIQEHPHIYNIIWESLHVDKKLFVEYYEKFSANYQKNLNEAYNQGEIEKFDNEVISYMLMGISSFIGLRYVTFEKNVDLEVVVDEVMRVLDSGIFTPKGVKHQD